MREYKNVDRDRLLEAVKESQYGISYIGFCVACGAERGGCEPDARQYECYECGENTVYGAEELLMYIGF